MTITERFFCEICAEKSGIIRCKNVKTAKRVLVCLTMKSVLLLDSSRNISSVDEVPSQYSKLLCSKVLSTNRSALGRSTVQLADKADS